MTAANLHATAVAFGPSGGVLILGASGSGKSRLALALIGEGAQLVADDQVFLAADGGALFARAPRATAGLIEVRGLGILRFLHRRLARVRLAIDLDIPVARLPARQTRTLNGVTIPCLPGTPDTMFARGVAHYLSGSVLAG